LADIQHIVVLMLENRSFDHMLGFMKSQMPSLDGLNGTEWNPEDASNPVGRIPVSSDAGYLDLRVDPSHWTPDVLDQIYSTYKCGTNPNHDVSLGDVLIADVYEALRNSPQWEQTLLAILWELAGFYPHAEQVPTPGRSGRTPFTGWADNDLGRSI
jgi:phospholipase C